MSVSLVFGCIFTIVISVGILGNIFVIITLLTCRKLRQAPVNWMLLHLAVADLGNLAMIIPDLTQQVFGQGWNLPAATCPISRFLSEMFLYSSLLHQVVICVERYITICVPLQKEHLITQHNSVIASVVCWSWAHIFAAPYALFHRRVPFTHKQGFYCGPKHSNSTAVGLATSTITTDAMFGFKVIECMVLYFIPLAIMTVLYAQTVARLTSNKAAVYLYATQKMAHLVLKLRRSVVKMLIVSMAIYYFCYSPIQTIFLCEYLLTVSIPLPIWTRLCMNALAVASSAANPLVYVCCSRQFRDRFIDFCEKIPACRRFIIRKDSQELASLKKPVPANMAIRTHMALAVRMGDPELKNKNHQGLAGISVNDISRQASVRRKLAVSECYALI